jgi:hypothetical protein
MRDGGKFIARIIDVDLVVYPIEAVKSTVL